MADDALRGDLANSTDPTKGAALVGYNEYQNVRETLDNVINIRSFGFSPAASAATNTTALTQAITHAKGRPIIIESDEDYEMDRLSIQDLTNDVNLHFKGTGYVKKLIGSGGVFSTYAPTYGVQNVTAITDTTTSINNVVEEVTRLTVADTGEYSAGDTIKIVSDDLDPTARDTGRRGEDSIVVKVEPGFIYIPRGLEDQVDYVTNVRVGRYSRVKVTIRGLKVWSNSNNTTQILFLGALVEPDIELYVEGKHAGAGINSSGCTRGRFKVWGDFSSGQDASGSIKYLTYAFVDGDGSYNTLYDSVCRGQRHLVTTAFPLSEANGSFRRHGATRDLTVINCTSIGGQNVPFDGHEGDRRTRFINCAAFGALQGTNARKAAFQIRGGDAQIINPTVDNTHDCVVAVGSKSYGTHHLIGGTSRCPILFQETSGIAPDIIIDSHNCTLSSLSSLGFLYATDIGITLRGGRYTAKSVAAGAARNVLPIPFGCRIHMDGPEFVLTDAGADLRVFNVTNGGRITGTASIRNDGSTPIDRIFHGDSDAANIADCDLRLLAGTYNSIRASVLYIPSLNYTLRDTAKSPVETVASQISYKASASSVDPAYARDMVFRLTNDTTLTIKVRGSDGVVRSVDLPLA